MERRRTSLLAFSIHTYQDFAIASRLSSLATMKPVAVLLALVALSILKHVNASRSKGKGSSASVQKFKLCHRVGANAYKLLKVTKKYLRSHLEKHPLDGRPGGSVPNNPYLTFDEACRLVCQGKTGGKVPGEPYKVFDRTCKPRCIRKPGEKVPGEPYKVFDYKCQPKCIGKSGANVPGMQYFVFDQQCKPVCEGSPGDPVPNKAPLIFDNACKPFCDITTAVPIPGMDFYVYNSTCQVEEVTCPCWPGTYLFDMLNSVADGSPCISDFGTTATTDSFFLISAVGANASMLPYHDGEVWTAVGVLALVGLNSNDVRICATFFERPELTAAYVEGTPGVEGELLLSEKELDFCLRWWNIHLSLETGCSL